MYILTLPITPPYLARVTLLLPHRAPLESGLPRPPRTARESEDPVPKRGDDGARSPNYHQGQAGVLRFPGEHHSGAQVLHAVQALRGAAY